MELFLAVYLDDVCERYGDDGDPSEIQGPISFQARSEKMLNDDDDIEWGWSKCTRNFPHSYLIYYPGGVSNIRVKRDLLSQRY